MGMDNMAGMMGGGMPATGEDDDDDTAGAAAVAGDDDGDDTGLSFGGARAKVTGLTEDLKSAAEAVSAGAKKVAGRVGGLLGSLKDRIAGGGSGKGGAATAGGGKPEADGEL